jgi:hypothetical protein
MGVAIFEFISVPLLNRRLCNYTRCRQVATGLGALRLHYLLLIDRTSMERSSPLVIPVLGEPGVKRGLPKPLLV